MGVLKRGDVWYVAWRDATGRWKRQRCNADTKAQAKVLLAELVRQADRQKRGLEPIPLSTGMTVWAMCDWWLNNHCQKPSLRRARSMLRVHVERTPLGKIDVRRFTPDVIDEHLRRIEKQGYAPRTQNLLKLYLGAAFQRAKLKHLVVGENPAYLVKTREVARAPRPTLTLEEIPQLLEKVPANWRGFFATAAYLGLRKGELCGLLKVDYDRVAATLYVGRSYDALTTKGKRTDYLPVPPQLAPFLDEALESTGPFLFPAPGGKRRGENSSPEDILRVAMRRLGWTEGWAHKCRRCVRGLKGDAKVKARTVVYAETDDPRLCPKCKFTLWPVAIPREMRFHDLRHTCATLLLKAGVPVQHVQRILRHSSITTTVGTYGHLMTEDLRSAVEKLGPPAVQGGQLRRIK